MHAKHTAVVMIDVDNDFLSEQGKLHGAVKSVLEARRVIPNINTLIGKARELGVTIIHVPIVFSADYPEMGENPYGIFKVVKDSGAFQHDTWGAQVADNLDLADSDVIVGNKSGTCAFANTQLDEVLKRKGITDIVLGGLLTNICVETTMRTAYDKGYTVHALTDCCATIDFEQQENAIKYNWPLFSLPVTHHDVLNQLSAAAA